MNEKEFFDRLDLLLKDSIEPLDSSRVIDYYHDRLDKCKTIEEREKVFNNFKSPETIVKPIIAMQNFTKRSEIKNPYSITVGFASLFSKFKENKTFAQKLVNILIVLIISIIVVFFITLSAYILILGIKLFFKLSIFDISIKLILIGISSLSFGISILLLQFALTSLRHLPYLGLLILRRMKNEKNK